MYILHIYTYIFTVPKPEGRIYDMKDVSLNPSPQTNTGYK